MNLLTHRSAATKDVKLRAEDKLMGNFLLACISTGSIADSLNKVPDAVYLLQGGSNIRILFTGGNAAYGNLEVLALHCVFANVVVAPALCSLRDCVDNSVAD